MPCDGDCHGRLPLRRRLLGRPSASASIRASVPSPMVGTAYRAPEPGATAVRRGRHHGERRARRCSSSRR
ncbi:MAG: hypothetical protein MZV49_10740 [Rhodopseudomonas palustris]|nr:hypothetical protein [Rhodopseudomonas palustris]